MLMNVCQIEHGFRSRVRFDARLRKGECGDDGARNASEQPEAHGTRTVPRHAKHPRYQRRDQP